MQKLIPGLLSMFVKENLFIKNEKIRPFGKIYKIDLNDTKKLSVILDQNLKLKPTNLMLWDKSNWMTWMRQFLIGVTLYLLENLPYDKTIIKDAQFLHPYQSLTDDKCVNAIQRL